MADYSVRWITCLADFIFVGLGSIIVVIFRLAVTPTERGFFCDDESIRYQFKPSTVPNSVLYTYGVFIPLIVMSVSEILANRRKNASGLFICRQVPLWILCTYRSFADFLFGWICSQLITEIGKFSIGRLRPHFIDVCQPDMDVNNCGQYNNTYITNYQCTGRANDVSEARLSFPSGHACFSAYAMLYTTIFIQVKVQVENNSATPATRIFKHTFQLALILLSYFTAISRVMDNKHHWSDVLGGGLIGSITAIVVARYVSGLRKGTTGCKFEKTFDDLTGGKNGFKLNTNSNIEASAPSGIILENLAIVE